MPALSSLESHMVKRFASAGVGDSGVQSFAHDHGFVAELLTASRAEAQYVMLTDYETHATCRGGGRLLRRRDAAASGPAWLVDIESGGARRRWALEPQGRGSGSTLRWLLAAAALVVAAACLAALLAR